MDLRQRFSRKVKIFRERDQLTVAQLADELGCARMQVWRWENKDAFPSPETLDALAKKFDVDVVELFGEA